MVDWAVWALGAVVVGVALSPVVWLVNVLTAGIAEDTALDSVSRALRASEPARRGLRPRRRP